MRRLLLSTLLLAGCAWGQPTWKTFSIGPPTGKNTRTNREGLQGEGVPFLRIVARAYGVPEYLVGGLDSMGGERYAITALVHDPKDLQPLLQKELAERFHLVAHHEKKSMPVYILKTIPGEANRLAPAKPGSRSGGLGSLATGIGEAIHVPVIDETGIEGNFNIDFTWDQRGGQSLDAAVRDQLGLQVTQENREIEMVMVDHVEKPGGEAVNVPLADGAQALLGDWEGVLGTAKPLHLVLHLARTKSGGLQGSMDSVDQAGGNGVAMTSAAFANGKLAFRCSSILATFEGRLTLDGSAIEGVWTQDKSYPVTWQRAGSGVGKTAEVSDYIGVWKGDLRMGMVSMALVVHLKTSAQGLKAELDSPDEEGFGVPARSVTVDNGFLTIDWKNLTAVYRARMNRDFSALEGTFSQAGMQGLLTLARVKDESTLVRRRPQMPLKPYPYREDEVTFVNSEAHVKLAGTLTIPEGAGPFPAAVLISGSGPNDRDETIAGHKLFLVLADHLTRQGIAVLRFDKRGVGDSGGHFDKALTLDFASDVEAAVRYLTTRKEVDARRLGLIGHSEGGMIAPLVAAKNHEIAFTVLLAGPGVTGAELAAEQSASSALLAGGDQQMADEVSKVMRAAVAVMQRTGGHPGDPLSELKQQLGSEYSEQYMKTALEKLDQPWMRGFLAIDPADALRKVTCPVLALNGSKDLQVLAGPNLKAIRQALAESGNVRAEVLEIAGLNHLFQTAKTGAPVEYGQIEESMAPAALEKITSWIRTAVQ